MAGEPNGWGVLHDRTALDDGGEAFYIFGPLPSREVADLIQSALGCSCRTRVVPLYFPNGVTMRLEAMMYSPHPLDAAPVDGHIH